MTSSEPAPDGGLQGDDGQNASRLWLGPLLLALTPFALFAALLALDRLLP
jgi:hypothetical protein